MVAGGEHVHAAVAQFEEALAGEAAAAGHVLAIGDAELAAVLTEELGDEEVDGVTPAFANNVAHEKYAHAGVLCSHEPPCCTPKKKEMA